MLAGKNCLHSAGGPSDHFEATPRHGKMLEVLGSVFDCIAWVSTPSQNEEFTFGGFQDPNTITHAQPAIDRF
jgi:hypothetical protein